MPQILAEPAREIAIGIRPALLRDIPQILAIERLTFGEQWDYHQFRASLDDIFLVAVDGANAEIVGFVIACCCLVSRRGLISRIAVHPAYQGRGIATRLLTQACQGLKKKGLLEVDLDVDILKAGARHLYEKLGFRVVEVFTPDIEDEDSFYLMRKKLDP